MVLLAGGVGKRMKADRPKQFLELLGKPVLLHSLEIFSTLPGVNRCVPALLRAILPPPPSAQPTHPTPPHPPCRIVIVLDQSYRKDFAFLQEQDPRIVFADPGKYVHAFAPPLNPHH